MTDRDHDSNIAHQEPWKVPRSQFIEYQYQKRFGKTRPDAVQSMESARMLAQKKVARHEEEQPEEV